MRQAIKEVNDIKRMREAIKNTKSAHLINDYRKAIVRKTNALKEYCRYRGFKFEDLGL